MLDDSARNKKPVVPSDGVDEAAELILQALIYGNEDLLAELLGENAEAANVRDRDGRNALHHAVFRGRVGCARALLRAGVSVDACAGERDGFKTPLQIAAEIGDVEMAWALVDGGADLFHCDANGHTALQLAQMNERANVAQALLTAIERTYAEAVEMRDQLCAACLDGDQAMVASILARAPANARGRILNGEQRGTADEKSALYIACEHGQAEIVETLLTVTQHSIIYLPTGDSVLHATIASQSIATVELIVQKFPYLMDVANNEGSFALHWACRCGNLDVIRTLLEAHYPHEEMKLIETSGPAGTGPWCYRFVCDLNATDSECRTPLYLAAANGHSSVVQYLVDFKVRVHSSSDALSVSSGGTVKDDVLSHKSTEGSNTEPSSILDEARNGAEAKVLRCPFQLDTYCKSGRIAVMTACANGNVDIARILINAGSDVNLPIALTDVEISDLKPMEEARCTGSGALVEAARLGNSELIRLLLGAGAFDYDNQALAVAISNDNRDLVPLFLRQLTFRDSEYRINKNAQSLALGGGGASSGNALSSVANSLLALGTNSNAGAGLLSATGFPTVACQLNWHNASLNELRLDWLITSAIYFNTRTRLKKLALAALTRIDLSNNRLATAPILLFQLPSLRVLNLEQNCIVSVDFPHASQDPNSKQQEQPYCPVLEELSLAGNYLTDLPLQIFSDQHFPALKVLNVGGNRLTTLPSVLWLAPRLRELNASNNRITELRTRVGRRDASNRAAAAERNQRQYYQRRHQSSQNFQRRLQLYQQQKLLLQQQQQNDKAQSRTNASNPKDSNHQTEQTYYPQASLHQSAMEEQRLSRRERSSRISPLTSSHRNSSGDAPGKARRRSSDAVTVRDVDVIRVNLWQKRIELSNIENDDDDEKNHSPQVNMAHRRDSSSGRPTGEANKDEFISMLRILNLAGNKLKCIPQCLACCCPRLIRLDLSMNEIDALGAVECLPATLRHLNLAHNQLTKCFQRVTADEDPLQFLCSAPSGTFGGTDGGASMSMSVARKSIDNNYSMNRHSRSRSKSVARNQRSLSVMRNESVDNANVEGARGRRSDNHGAASNGSGGLSLEPCVHKSHCKLEALKTLNLAHNSLSSVELLAPFGGRSITMEQFNWKENGQQMKSYLLFPALTTLDVSHNRLRAVPPTISLLSYLSIFNVSANLPLENLPPELGLLEKLWNVSVKKCALKEPLKGIVEQDNYKTTELLAVLRNKLENSKPYPKLKLMILGGQKVGKTSLLKQIRQEGHFSKKSLQSESWSLRMGYSPSKLPTAPAAANAATQVGGSLTGIQVVDIAEWGYEPRKKSSTTSSTRSSSDTAFTEPITFRTWDFVGINKEFSAVQQYFFTRRCLYLVVWKVTEGEIALSELHEHLLAIQTRAPNATVIIVGTHLDSVKENSHRFPNEYLTELDGIVQERFVNVSDADKKGLPRVLASIYVSTRSRDDVRALCSLLYQVAGEMRVANNRRQRLLAERVPASYLALEKIVVAVTDELRSKAKEPVLTFDDFWVLATTQMMEEFGRPFRDILEFRQACQFLHENGVIVYFDDTSLRDFVFLDPPWLCAFLCTALLGAGHNRDGSRSRITAYNSSFGLSTRLRNSDAGGFFSTPLPYDAALIDIQRMYATLKFALRQFGAAATRLTTGGDVAAAVATKFRLFRACFLSLLSKFELALPCLNGALLLASLLPDEYLLRADYPGAKVRVQAKICKWQLRRRISPNSRHRRRRGYVSGTMLPEASPSKASSLSPIRSYLAQRRIVRHTLVQNHERASASIDRVETGSPITAVTEFGCVTGGSSQRCGSTCTHKSVDSEPSERISPPRITMKRTPERNLRRLYVMQYVPPGFWARLMTRLLDDESIGTTFSRLFVLTEMRYSSTTSSSQLGTTAEPNMQSTTPSIVSPKSEADLLQRLNETFNELAGNVSLTSNNATSQTEMAEIATEETFVEEEEETSFIINASSASKLSQTPNTSAVKTSPSVPSNLRDVPKGQSSRTSSLKGSKSKSSGAPQRYGFEWLLWRTGIEIRSFGAWLFSLKEFLPLADVRDVNYSLYDLARRADDGSWKMLKSDANQFLVEVLIPHVEFELHSDDSVYRLEIDSVMATKLMSIVTNILDDLLEDWFPALGTRYVHTSEGRLLIDRLVPCHLCAAHAIQTGDDSSMRRRAERSVDEAPANNVSNNTPKRLYLFSIEECILQGRRYAKSNTTELLSLSTYSPQNNSARRLAGSAASESLTGPDGKLNGHQYVCPNHLDIALSLDRMAPDVGFADLEAMDAGFVIGLENVRRGKLVGRGAFGFVFNGLIRQRGDAYAEVALKVLEPVDPGSSAGPSGSTLMSSSMITTSADEDRALAAMEGRRNLASARAAFEAFRLKWQHDASENAARAYCTARQELNMLSGIRHAHVTSLLGFVVAPMTLVVELAPHGALDTILAKYRRHNARLHFGVLQQTCVQIAKALEYLHANHIIYRDLKSENVLVWRFPSPAHAGGFRNVPAGAGTGDSILLPSSSVLPGFTGSVSVSSGAPAASEVHVKLGDYGISRNSYPSGVCKGYGGTEGFMAPEVMRYNGEQEYTERVDCYSFGMFIYELLSLKQPYEGMDQMKDFILEGRRPYVSEKELLYPSGVLDLMVACWSESADDRPSASQLVGICSAPEFSRLLDIAVLSSEGQHHEDSVADAGSVTFRPCTVVVTDGDGLEPSSQCWFLREAPKKSRNGSYICVMSSSQFGWTEQKLVLGGALPPPDRVDALCQADANEVWLADADANIFVYSARTFANLGVFSILPFLDLAAKDQGRIEEHCNQKSRSTGVTESTDSNTKPSESTDHKSRPPGPPGSAGQRIKRIQPYVDRGLMIMATSHYVLVLRLPAPFDDSPEGTGPLSPSRTSLDSGGESFVPPVLIDVISMSEDHEIFDVAVLESSTEEWQIWTTHCDGKMIVHHMNGLTDQLIFSTSIPHFAADPPAAADRQPRIRFIVPSFASAALIWTSLEYDSRIFQWRRDSPAAIHRTLNCAKILPGSESLSSMNLNVIRDVHITAMRLLTPTARRFGTAGPAEKLIVGTNHGVVIVIDAEQMLPLSSFRPLASAIDQILVCNDARTAALLSPGGGASDPMGASDEPAEDSGEDAPRRASTAAARRELVQMRDALGGDGDAPAAAAPKWTAGRRLSAALRSRFSALGSQSARSPTSSSPGGSNRGSQLVQSSSTYTLPTTSQGAGGGALEAIGARYDAVARGVKDILRGGTQPRGSAVVAAAGVGATAPDEGTFVVVGRDYRCLLSRFLGGAADNGAEIGASADPEARYRGDFALFWRSDDWTSK